MRTGTRVGIRIKRISLLIALAFFGFFGLTKHLIAANLYNFVETADPGFGIEQNKASVYDNAVAEFNGQLYVSVENTQTGAQIWRTDTGDPGDWESVVGGGFGDDNNYAIGALVVFNGRLYAGTINTIKGAEIWRTLNGVDWDPVVADEVDGNAIGTDENGLGLGNNNDGDRAAWGIGSAVVANGQLFVGTLGDGTVKKTVNGTVWTTSSNEAFGMGVKKNVFVHDMTASATYVYAALGNTNIGGNRGAQVWRCKITDICDAQVDWSRVTTPGLGVAAGNIDHAYTIELYNKDLYIGTDEAVANKGGQIWGCTVETSCENQQKWNQRVSDGFGNQDGNSEVLDLYGYANELYAFTHNGDDGAELYRSRDGVTFELVSDAGLTSDVSNDMGRKLIAFSNDLHAFLNMKDGLVAVRKKLDPSVNFLVGTPRKDGTGGVALDFRFDDPDKVVNGQARIEYSIDGGQAYHTATLSSLDANASATFGDPSVKNGLTYPIYNIDASQGQNPAFVVWNTKMDATLKDIANAKLRITPYDGYGEGTTFTTPNFHIDTLPPTISNLLVQPTATRAGIPLTITFSVNEILNANPTVTVDGHAAQFGSVNALSYKYTYTPTGNETEGAVSTTNIVLDGYLNQSSDTKSVVLDFTPPETAAVPAGGTYAGAQDVVLQADDESVQQVGITGTGVSTIYYTTDGSEPTTASAHYVGPIHTADSGTTTIRYFSVDAVGNTETGQTAAYTVTSDAPEGDAGFVLVTVYHDADRDAVQDVSEDGLAGVTVRLYQDVDADGVVDSGSDTLLATDVSGAGGDLTFSELAQGNYLVSINESTVPSGYALTTGNNPGSAVLSAAGQGLTAVFGYAAPASTVPPGNGDSGGDTGDGSGTQPGDGNGDNTVPDGGDTTQPNTGDGDGQTPSDQPGQNGGTGDVTPTPDEPNTTPSLPKRILDNIRQGLDNIFGSDPQTTDGTKQGGTTSPSGDTSGTQTGQGTTTDSATKKTLAKTQKELDTVQEGTLSGILQKAGERGVQTLFTLISLSVFVLAAGNLALVSQGFFTYVRYLLQLITEPFRLLAGHKTRRWGTVFDAETGSPLDLAIVRLMDADSGKLLQTSVTDRRGRYLFLVSDVEHYRLAATRKSYIFPPAHLLTPRRELYQGGVVGKDGQPIAAAMASTITSIAPVTGKTSQEASVIRLDIPMSQTDGEVFLAGSRKPIRTAFASLTAFSQARKEERAFEDRRMQRAHLWRRVALVSSYIGPFVGLVAVLREPNWITAGLFTLHLLLFLLFRRLAVSAASKPWGRVLDLGFGTEISGAVVRLFDEKYGKLLLVKVTGRDGRYAFLTGTGRYQLNASKDQYLFPEGAERIESSNTGEVSKDLGLRREA